MASSSPTKRIILFDALKLFAIFLVLWGHVIQYLRSSHFADEPIYRAIYSFHMPLFMMIVGFFYARTLKNGFIKTTIKKFRTLIYPALIWCLIFSVLKTIKIGLPSYDYISMNLEHSFWFLKCAFICCLLSYPICKYQKLRILLGGVIFLFTQLPSDNNLQLSFMYPCFLCGMFFQWNRSALKKVPPIAILIVCGSFFIIGNLFLDSDIYMRSFNAIYNETVWTNVHVILLRLYRIILGLSGTLFFICAFDLMMRKYSCTTTDKIITLLGAETLGIYILQSYIIEYVIARHVNLDHLSFGIFNFVVAPLLSLVVLLGAYVIIRILKSNRYSATIFFGDRLATLKKFSTISE